MLPGIRDIVPPNPTLLHQLTQLGIDPAGPPPDRERWQRFLDQVAHAYAEAGAKRNLMEQTQEVSSRELQELYARLEEAQRIAGIGHWSYEWQGHTAHWSEECFRIFGMETALRPPGLRDFLRRVQKRDLPMLMQSAKAALRKGETFEIEFRLYMPNRTGCWVRVRGQSVKNTRGMISRLHGTAVNITRRKQVELRQNIEHAVTRVLADSDALEESMPRIIQIICEAMGWPCGSLWILDRPQDRFERRFAWSVPYSPVREFFDKSKSTIRLPACSGLIGRVLKGKETAWIPDVTLDQHFPRAEAAAAAGLRAAFAFPIQAGGNIVGVMEFFSKHAQGTDQEMLQSAHFIGRHIGQFFQRKMAEHALRESEAHFRSVVEQASDSFYIHDGDGRFIDVNQHGCNSLGHTREQLLSMSFLDIDVDMSSDELAHLQRQVANGAPIVVESRHRRRDGTTFPVEIRMGPIKIDGEEYLLSLVRDVSERKALEEHIQHLAFHDSLTHLPNRAMFNRQLQHAILQAQRYNKRLAVLFIDLDRFKNINDTLGHDAGDRLLQEMARRLSMCLRGSDIAQQPAGASMVARLGGDEFVILVEEVTDTGRISEVANRLLATMVREYLLEGQLIHMTASIGISVFPEDGHNEFSLMKHADIAMYRAKASGKNAFQFYSSQMDVHSTRLLALESGLRRAIEREELTLHYQPKVDVHTGRVSGVEALVRWKHPDLGLVPPAHFIPLAEETGLIIPLSKWVLREACAQSMAWRSQGLPPVRIAVNLSARQFIDDNLPEQTAKTLQETGMDPALLEFEITESMMMYNTDKTIEVLSAFRRLGIRIAIDDFGIGYSSLSHLKQFPIDIIKMDRSFVKDIPADQADAAIADAIIAMGKRLGIRVVAEGVETHAQLVFLRERGCDEIQGYYFSKPLPAGEFARYLQRNLADASSYAKAN
jgi:diguanylate cyclase (GGDEF)-like protein/PAS domain S-box-containing protein